MATAPTIPQVSDAYLAENNAPQILGVTGSMFTLAMLALGFRIYARVCKVKALGSDDYVMLAAGAMALAVFIGFCGETRYGVGRHYEWATPEKLFILQKWQFYQNIFSMFGTVFVKISIVFFLKRIFPMKWFVIFMWASIVFLICFSLICAGTLIFSCIPVSGAWDDAVRAAPSTKCFSFDTFARIGLFNSIVNIATDILFAVIPIPIIFKLQISLRSKYSLVGIICLGFIACSAGIYKASIQVNFFNNPDRNYHYQVLVWATVEQCLGIMAASLPALKPLFSAILQSTKTRFGSSRSRTDPAKKRRTLGYLENQNQGSADAITDSLEMKDYRLHSSARQASDADLWEDHKGSSEENLTTAPPGIYKSVHVVQDRVTRW